MKTHLLALLAGALGVTTGTAHAADMMPVDYPPIYSDYADAPELEPVEIGTGWYLRGDVSYDLKSETKLAVERRTALAGDHWFDTTADIDEAFGLGGGVGYRFTDMLRGDVTARYSRADLGGGFDGACLYVGGSCQGSVSGESANWELMANAYVDFGTVVGFTPYVGAGAGAVRVDYKDARFGYCDSNFGNGGQAGCGEVGLESTKEWRFAYSLMAGLSYDLSQALKVDLGYRFTDVDGGDTVKPATVGFPNAPYDGLSVKDDGFQTHTVQAGLRYSLF